MAVKLDDGVDKWELQHLQDVERYERIIAQIYDEATSEVAKAIAVVPNYNSSAPFSVAKYPAIEKKINGIVDSLAERIQVAIIDGVSAQWTLSNNKNNELCNVVFGSAKSFLSAAAQRKYYTSNDGALKAFIARKEDGLDLSKRVWQDAEVFQEQIGLAIDIALRDGVSSAKMSTTLKQYLKEPERLFRRVADEHGVLHLSKSAKSYNPGQGRYRSSSKNSMRLAVTETNMAYRKADLVRWQQLDFVTGFEVKRSNHVYKCSVCEALKGKYPKDFVFTSWHPWCRCYIVPILKTEEEMAIDNERIMNGEEPLPSSKNTVTAPPKGFADWVKDKTDVIERAEKKGSLPYFLRDNKTYVDNALGRTSVGQNVSLSQGVELDTRNQMITEAATKRHAERDTVAIQEAWNVRKEVNVISAYTKAKEISSYLVDNGYAQSVNLGKMSIENMKDIAIQTVKISKRFKLEALQKIDFSIFRGKAQKAFAMSHGELLAFNSSYWNVTNRSKLLQSYKNSVDDYVSPLQQRIGHKKQIIDGYANLLEKLKLAGEAKSELDFYENRIIKETLALKDLEKLAKDDKHIGRYLAMTSFDDMAKITTQHEFGHIVHDQLLGGINASAKTNAIRVGDTAIRNFNDKIRSYFDQNKNNISNWLSEYGVQDYHEFVAESFVLYLGNDPLLPTEVRAWFEDLEDLLKK